MYTYEYGAAGNILRKNTYALTASWDEPSELVASDIYGYGNADWGGQLTSYNGDTIRYDAIGNPLRYSNGNRWSFTWEHGRRLAQAEGNGYPLSFTYNDEGIRTSKTGNGVVHTYRLNGSQIVAEEWTTAEGDGTTVEHMILFLYDAEGTPVGMQYRNQTYAPEIFDVYWFEKNLQGDVVAVYDAGGTKLISYTYDAWGNFTTYYNDCTSSNPANFNPYRYRSYYYDAELEMYYLKSRYYDPEICRCINADDISCLSANGDFASYNLYAYCGNNPVSRKDDGGEFWHIVIGAAIGAVVNGALKVAENLLDGDSGTDWNDGVLLAAAMGAVTGGFAVTGCGPVVQMAVNAAATAVEELPSAVEAIRKGEDVITTLGGYAIEVGLSAVTSHGPGLGSKAVTNLGKQTAKRTANAFAHDGILAGFKEVGKAARWYWKSAKKYIGRISLEQAKGILNGIADDAIRDAFF